MSILAYLLLALAARTAAALTFDLPYAGQKCFSEDFQPRTTVKGKVHVATGRGGADMKLDVYVTNQQGVVSFHRADVNTVAFTFVTGDFAAHTTAPYRVCVLHQTGAYTAHPPAGQVYRRITLDLAAVRRQADTSTLATKSHADRTIQSFHDVSLSVDRLIDAMDEIRAREQALSDVGTDTSTLIVRISLVASLFTILTGLLNFITLKSFFKQKKLA